MSQVNINDVSISGLIACRKIGAAAELLALTLKLPKLVGKELDERTFRRRIDAQSHFQSFGSGPSLDDCRRESNAASGAELMTFRMLYRLPPRED